MQRVPVRTRICFIARHRTDSLMIEAPTLRLWPLYCESRVARLRGVAQVSFLEICTFVSNMVSAHRPQNFAASFDAFLKDGWFGTQDVAVENARSAWEAAKVSLSENDLSQVPLLGLAAKRCPNCWPSSPRQVGGCWSCKEGDVESGSSAQAPG